MTSAYATSYIILFFLHFLSNTVSHLSSLFLPASLPVYPLCLLLSTFRSA